MRKKNKMRLSKIFFSRHVYLLDRNTVAWGDVLYTVWRVHTIKKKSIPAYTGRCVRRVRFGFLFKSYHPSPPPKNDRPGILVGIFGKCTLFWNVSKPKVTKYVYESIRVIPEAACQHQIKQIWGGRCLAV